MSESRFTDVDRTKMRRVLAQVAITAGLVAPDLTNDAALDTLHNLLDFVNPRMDKADTFDMSDARIVAKDEETAAVEKPQFSRGLRVNEERFASRVCNEHQLARIAAIRSAFVMVGDTVAHAVNRSPRYHALTMTALEEACMWAIKGISHEEGTGR